MDEELKKRIRIVCNQPPKSIDNDDDDNLVDEWSLLNKWLQTLNEFNLIIPKLQQNIQSQEMDATFNISALSFLNDSLDRSINKFPSSSSTANSNNSDKYFSMDRDFHTIISIVEDLRNFDHKRLQQIFDNNDKQVFEKLTKKLETYLDKLNLKFK
ncbi:hypothetical protein DERP_003746 [Dermatophagoides pteronyssinus]|uniref:Uncharacterized protein n=1 Tax=Dermatophagoides pteronyssinus TaxID=6956 RepID=A0ABQ8JLW3_DERPT|nr:hypothetical protein DERP_003746 [Dermatophagoides pteronyssinus]